MSDALVPKNSTPEELALEDQKNKDLLTDTSAEHGLTLTEEGRPPEINKWAPVTSDQLTEDMIIREMARIAFDAATPLSHRASMLKELAKHKGMYIERSETHHVDHTKVMVAQEMFKGMSIQERLDWLEQHSGDVPTQAFARPTDGPPDEMITIKNETQEEADDNTTSQEDQTADPKKPEGCGDGDLPDFFTNSND